MRTVEEIKEEIKRRKEKAKICNAKNLYEVITVKEQIEAITALEWVIEKELIEQGELIED